MATNLVHRPGWQLSVAATHPSEPVAGDPVRLGEKTGVALTDRGDGGNPTTHTTVDFGPAVWELEVEGVDGGGNEAVAVGDKIYYTDADDPVLNKKDTGRYFGIALEAVGSGATAVIKVAHEPSS